MVNGQKVMLSDDEEKELRKEWAQAREEQEKRRQSEKQSVEKQQILREKLAKMMGVTLDDVLLMMGKKNGIFRD